MPKLPDITVYLECLAPRVLNRAVERIAIPNPFVLPTFDPPIDAANGKRVVELRRLGKRIVLGLEGGLFVTVQLMTAG